jgi:hypothetical protein
MARGLAGTLAGVCAAAGALAANVMAIRREAILIALQRTSAARDAP